MKTFRRLLKKLTILITCLFGITATISVSACTSTQMFSVMMTNSNEEGGNIVGEGSYKANSQVTISYSANKGYKFSGWQIDGSKVKTSGKTYTFTMPNKDIVIEGDFEHVLYNLEVEVNGYMGYGDIVSGAGQYFLGTVLSYTAVPKGQNEFLGWYVNDEFYSNELSIDYTVSNEAKVVAKFTNN